MADITSSFELIARLLNEPEMAQVLANDAPEEVDFLLKMADVPLLRWWPFGIAFNKVWGPYEGTNTAQAGFIADSSGHKWAVSGNRSGKTEGEVAEDIFDCLLVDTFTRKPHAFYKKPILAWVISDLESTSIDIIQKKVADFLGPETGLGWGLVKDEVTYTEKNGFGGHRLAWINGSILGFKYSSQGRRAVQGTAIDKAHFDEEPPRDIYGEVYARTIDRNGKIAGTFTPVFEPRRGMSWIYYELFLQRDKKNISFHNWTLDDNPFLSGDAKEKLVEEWDEDEADVRRKGLFVPMGIPLVFGSGLLKETRAGLKSFEEGRMGLDKDGNAVFLEETGRRDPIAEAMKILEEEKVVS